MEVDLYHIRTVAETAFCQSQPRDRQYVAKEELIPNGNSLKRVVYILDPLVLPSLVLPRSICISKTMSSIRLFSESKCGSSMAIKPTFVLQNVGSHQIADWVFFFSIVDESTAHVMMPLIEYQ